jgi:glycosyltransferase involved in cell wall biosynthesis
MRPLRVAYILLHFPYLTETFVAEEIRAMRAQGVDVQIISLLEPGGGPPQRLSQELLPYCRYAPSLGALALWLAQFYFLITAGGRYFSTLYRLLRCPYPHTPLTLLAKRLVIFLKAVAIAHLLRRERVDLLHAHFAWLPGAGAWVCARLLRRPYSVTAHAYDLFASTDLLALVAGAADDVIAISEYNRQFLARAGIRPAEAIAVIHCGVDLCQIDANAALRPLSAPEAPVRILSVGSLNQKKGHQYLIEACRILKERGLAFVCTIIGGGSDETRLRALIEQHGLQAEVQLLGPRPNDEIMAAYRAHDLFALACVVAADGDRDGIPVVMMEAGAHGLPLVSTEVSGIPELAQPQRTGLVAPPADPAALADAIFTLAQDPALRQRLGENARELVHAEFNSPVNAQRLLERFQQIAGKV